MVDLIDKLKLFEENLATVDGKYSKRTNSNSEDIAALRKEAKNIQPMLKEI